MRIEWRLLFFVFLFVQGSLQWANKRATGAEERTEGYLNEDIQSSDEHPKKLQELQALLRQTTNSSSTTTAQITATRQGPCQCGNGVCGCCSRILYDTWKQKACVNVTYDPDEFSFTAKVSMNSRVLYTRTVSGKWV